MSDTSKKIFDLVIVGVSATMMLFIVNIFANKLDVKNQDNGETIENISDNLDQIDLTNEVTHSTPKTLVIATTENPIEQPNDAFEKFTKLASRIIAYGDFQKVSMDIEMESEDDDLAMISITLDNESGIYRAYRSAFDKINKTTSKNLGGIFAGKSISVNIPLTEDIVLATTGDEYALTGASTKTLTLWDNLLVSPPTVFRLMIVPISVNDGNFNSYSITRLNLNYTCKDDSNSCQLILCTADQPNYFSCLAENLGMDIANSWYSRSGL